MQDGGAPVRKSSCGAKKSITAVQRARSRAPTEGTSLVGQSVQLVVPQKETARAAADLQWSLMDARAHAFDHVYKGRLLRQLRRNDPHHDAVHRRHEQQLVPDHRVFITGGLGDLRCHLARYGGELE
jgi:hypothetical protein